MRFDYDLMKLQPRGVDSVEWQERIVRDGGQSIWSAVRVVDCLDDARRLKHRLLALPSVGKVDGIGLLIPDDDAEKIERLAQTRSLLGEALTEALQTDALQEAGDPQPDPRTPNLNATLSTMRLFLAASSLGQMPPAMRDALDHLKLSVDRVLATLASLPGDVRDERLGQLQQEYAQWRRDTAARIDAALNTSPLTTDDLPGELLRPYVAEHGPLAGRFALEIHPRLPADGSVTSPLDPVFLPRFIRDIESVPDPGKLPYVTGVIVQIYRSGSLIKSSYLTAGVYALLVVFILVWLDFRSVRAAGLSLVPVAVGFAATFGVMWLVGMSVNAANVIVLPLMFGIGVDAGVHILHRYRQNPSQRPLGLACGTGKGITVTSLTTIIGFGTMTLARHRGIASLGFVLAVGIGLTLLACWTIMPAWLELRGAGRLRAKTGG